MNEATPVAANGRAEALVASYERAGYVRREPAILQPAEPFLDLSGEDIRRRMYLTTDTAGRELCLRPDFTIAVSRDYLASADAGRAAGFCYLGPIFRQQDDGAGELIQAGIESFGRRDTAAADAEIFALGLEATSHYGIADPDIRMGDVGLFIALIDALKITPAWKRRLVKDFNRAGRLAQDLDMLMRDQAQSQLGICRRAGGAGKFRSGRGACAGHRPAVDRRHLGRRRPHRRRDRRPVSRTGDARRRRPAAGSARADRTLSRHRRRSGHGARRTARRSPRDASLALDPALDLFESRTGFLAARGVDVDRIRFSTAFSTSLDYYTGCEFRLHDPSGRDRTGAGRRRTLRQSADAARQPRQNSRGRPWHLHRTPRRRRETRA